MGIGLWPLVSCRFQVLFHSPKRGSFHLSLTVLVHYRSLTVFSLGGWSLQIQTRFHVSGPTQEPARISLSFAYGAFTLYRPTFQMVPLEINFHIAGPTTPKDKSKGLGYSHFARRYYGNHFCFLFLRLLRCLTSAGIAFSTYVFSWEWREITPVGFPHSDTSGS